MSKGEGKAPSQRQLRVGEELRHVLAWILERGEIHDPGLGGAAITVTEVRISPDLRNATAYVMPLGGDDVPDVIQALNRAAPYVRRLMSKQLELRRLPNLIFEADHTFEEAGRIDDLLRTPPVARDIASDLEPDDAVSDSGPDSGETGNGS
ncbi:MAG: 30S ribosome-binding factor RbfA [Rhodospirillales bacterium]|nr:30S ribosome-binding factor RbfA [Alphaproteobacteria bacterium]MBL6948393.1 30S ribosome-binding factor RbfA [Rhodospirillales bacterium]